MRCGTAIPARWWTPDDIAELVAIQTGVPVMQLAQEESVRLLNMEDELHNSIIGQSEAIQRIAKAGAARPRGSERPPSPHWFIHVPGTDRRG